MRKDTHHSLETKRKISKAKKGTHHSLETRKKMSEDRKGEKNLNFGKPRLEKIRKKISEILRGKKNFWRGKHHSLKTKEKMSQSHKGKKFSIEHKRNLSKARKGEKSPWYGKKHSIITKEKMSKLKEGKNNPSWIHGKSLEPYNIEFNNRLKRKIRKRDNYQCQFCGTKQNGRKFPVHHIDYDKKNSREFNLITICYSHHRKTNFNREKWQFFFETYQEIRNIFFL